MTRSTGKLFEKALIGELIQQGFAIPKHDATLDHDAKLDFVIQRFPGSIMHHQVGVQVTVGEHNNIKKMQEFEQVHSGRYEKGVQRSVYLQADNNLDLDGGAFVIGAAITQFQFDKTYASERVIGIEVGEDLSYGLFGLRNRVSTLNAEQVAKAVIHPIPGPPPSVQTQQAAVPTVLKKSVLPTISGILEGQLTYWIPDGAYGFILAQDNDTYYLHYNAVSDDKLRTTLNHLQERTRYPLESSVEFEPGPKRAPGDTYRPARNVRLATGKPFIG